MSNSPAIVIGRFIVTPSIAGISDGKTVPIGSYSARADFWSAFA